MNVSQHITTEHMVLRLDGKLDASDAFRVDEHLRECTSCRSGFESLRRVHHALLSLPLENTSREFAQGVLSSLHLRHQSRMFRMVEKFAYVLGLFVVLAATFAILLLTGVVRWEQVSSAQTTTETALRVVGRQAGELIGGVTGWMSAYLPEGLISGSAGLLAWISAALAVLLVVDGIYRRTTNLHLRQPH